MYVNNGSVYENSQKTVVSSLSFFLRMSAR